MFDEVVRITVALHASMKTVIYTRPSWAIGAPSTTWRQCNVFVSFNRSPVQLSSQPMERAPIPSPIIRARLARVMHEG
jgi:hypothetical protein